MVLQILAGIGATIIGMISFFMFWALYEGEIESSKGIKFIIALICLIISIILADYAGLMGDTVDDAFIRGRHY